MSDSQKEKEEDSEQKLPLRLTQLHGLGKRLGGTNMNPAGGDRRFTPNVSARKPRFTPKVPDRKNRPIKTEVKEEDKEGDTVAALMNLEVSSSDKVNRRQACDRAGLNAAHSSIKRRDHVIMGGGLKTKSSNFAKSNKEREDHKETLENYFFQTEQDSKIYAPALLPFHRVSKELKEKNEAVALEREGKDPALARKKSHAEEHILVDADDEKSVSTLFLTDENTTKEDHLMLLQLPADLPLKPQVKKGEVDPDVEMVGDDEEQDDAEKRKKKLVPNSQLGKLIFYKSGKVKMKIGDSLFDVKEGMDCQFYQEVVAVNKKERIACFIDQLNKKLVASPNIEDLIS